MPLDLRTQKLAKLVVKYSVFVKPNENVVISGSIEAQDFLLALYKEVILARAHPILRINLPGTTEFFYKNANKEQIEKFPWHFDHLVKNSQKYIGVSTEFNTRELTNCNPKKITARAKVTASISHYICDAKPKIHRCTVGFPCQSLAQEAEMSQLEYENFVFGACLQDWHKLGKQMDKIKSKFKKNSQVHLIGNGIDLKMSVHGHLAVADKGEENMPGGEVFMAPIKESLEGWVKFDYPAVRDGKEVADIFVRFEKGKVIEAKASKNEDFLKAMLSTDANAAYVGELGIGCNPKVTKFTKDLLFDEKIGGTVHLAFGKAYNENIPETEKNNNFRASGIHWDIVKSMKRAKIIVDGKIIQENGKWKL
jgi:aminopeptidase